MNKYLLICLLFLMTACENEPVKISSKNVTVEESQEERISEDEKDKNAPVKDQFKLKELIELKSCENVLVQFSVSEFFEREERNSKTETFITLSSSNLAVLNPDNEIEKYLFPQAVNIEQIHSIERNVGLSIDNQARTKDEDFEDYLEEQDSIKKTKEYREYVQRYESLVFINYSTEGYKKLLIYDLKNDRKFEVLPPEGNLLRWKEDLHKRQIIVRYNTDSNKDGEFTAWDDINLLRIDPHDLGTNEPIFNIPEIKNEIMEFNKRKRKAEEK